jgi:hypothetical protein
MTMARTLKVKKKNEDTREKIEEKTIRGGIQPSVAALVTMARLLTVMCMYDLKLLVTGL